MTFTDYLETATEFGDRFAAETLRFDGASRSPGSPTYSIEGVRQFHRHESRGVYPEQAEPYFTHLLDGKKWWEWTVNQIASRYGTPDWWGWELLAADYVNDPAGFRQIRRRCRETPVHPAAFLAD